MRLNSGHVGHFSRMTLFRAAIACCLSSCFFLFVENVYSALSPLERFMTPIFVVMSALCALGFAVMRDKYLSGLFAAFMTYASFVILVGLVEGAINPESHVEFYFVWIPIYYLALIFGAGEQQALRWALVFFSVSSLAILVALILGPMPLDHSHTGLFISSLLGQLVLLWLFSQLSRQLRETSLRAGRTQVAEENAELLRVAAQEASRARAEAVSANRAKSTFLANMSHELRTPLNAIIGFGQLLGHQAGFKVSEGKRQEYADDVVRSAEHLLKLINDMLDISKIEAGKFELNEQAVDLEEVFEEVAILMRPLAEKAGVRLTYQLDQLPIHMHADQRCLVQILVNLISNALRFSHKHGEVLAVARLLKSGAVELCVQDEGVGMDDETLDTVFEPFAQGRAKLKLKSEGTGLGLSLVKAMCELHGAHIRMTSKVGIGTSVAITFPPSRSKHSSV